jgi:ParB family chromosome partitioning protein
VIANARRLLKLPAAVQDALLTQRISAGHGRALLKFEAAGDQVRALDIILKDELTVREAERLSDLARRWNGDLQLARSELRALPVSPPDEPVARREPQQAAPSANVRCSPDDQALQRDLERVLGTPVLFVRTERAVRVTLTFYDNEKLQEFLALLGQG